MFFKTPWKDRVVTRPRTFVEEVNPDGSKTFTPAEGDVIQQGTPMNAEKFNHAETGTVDTHISVSVFMQYFLNFKRWLSAKISLLDVMLRIDIDQNLSAEEKARVRASLGLGAAALRDVGTSEGNLVELAAGGKLPSSTIPAYALSEYKGSVTNHADLITLSTAEKGDYGIVNGDADPGKNGTYMLDGTYSNLSDWVPISAPDAVSSVNGKTGVVVLAPSDIGAATAAQGTTADSALQPDDVKNNFTSTDTDKPLSALKGKELYDGKMPKTTNDVALKKGNGTGGLTNAVEGEDYVGIGLNGRANPIRITSKINSNYGDWMPVIGDAGRLIKMTYNAAPTTFTIPPESALDFPIETEIEIVQYGAGAVTILPGPGVTLNSAGNRRQLAEQFCSCSIKKMAAEEWWLAGDLV